MFGNYLKVALRNISRHKGYSVINILGLATGMACAILLFLWVQDELEYDRFHENIGYLYRVVIEDNSTNQARQVAITPAPLAPALKDEIAGIARSTRCWIAGAVIAGDNNKYYERVAMADPDFFEMFSFPLIRGNAVTALDNPHSAILTREKAVKYFGTDNVIGKTLRIDNRADLIITGVLDKIPDNSSLKFDFLIPFEYRREIEDLDFWGAWRFYTFVQIYRHQSMEEVNSNMAGVMNKYRGKDDTRLYLQPFRDIHLRSNLNYDMPNRGNIKHVWIFAAIGLLIILIACINYMNLTTARSGNRAGEIGLRKVVGAHRLHIIRQFYGESILFSFIALALAVVMVELLLPSFNGISGKQISLDMLNNINMMGGLAVIALITGIVSGSYPSLFLSSLRPAAIMQRMRDTGTGGSWMRKILVTVQFTLSVFLIIGAIVVHNQLQYMINKNLGFDKEYIVHIPVKTEYVDKYPALKDEFLKNPDVSGVTASFQLPNNIGSSPGSMDWEGRDPDFNLNINAGLVDFDYFETFGMEIIEGRGFSRDFASDTAEAYILNEEAVRQMGIQSPVGKWFSYWDTKGTIIGIVRDFHSTSLRNEINPIVLRLTSYWLNYMHVKLKSDNIHAALNMLEKSWNDMIPGFPFDYRFLDETIDNQYRSEKRVGTLFRYGTALAIFISCLGLFGLASYMAEKRTREIGIRKVLGASVFGLVLLLSREFIRLVILANVIAWPLAWYAMDQWLRDFAYRINPGWEVFALSGIMVLLTALLTVIYQALKAALANPVKTLRYE